MNADFYTEILSCYLLPFIAGKFPAQNCLIPSISCCLFIGFTSRLKNSFNSCHKFSIGFISGDSGGGGEFPLVNAICMQQFFLQQVFSFYLNYGLRK